MDSASEITYMGLQDYMVPCMNKKLFGFECPGCGLQRSLVLLLEGDFMGALQMYPAIYTLLPLALILVLNRFTNIRYYNSLIIGLSITSVVLILTNYIYKLTH